MSDQIERLKTRYNRAKTARKEAEDLLEEKSRELYLMNEELKTLATSLEQQVTERTKDLTLAKEEAERLSRTKSAFLANMSHELRTPINGVLGMLSILSQSNLSDRDKKRLNTASQSGTLLLKIINSILDISKLETDNVELESIEYNPLEILETTLNTFEYQCDNKNLSLVSLFPPALDTALIGDPTRLKQIVTNLLSNSIKFTQSGEIVVSAQHHNGRLTIAIKDTGIGIAKEMQENIFSPFSQEDESTTRKYGGTGLGLAISQQLAKLMNGNISLLSEIGKGSTFTVDIEAIESPQVASSTEQFPQLRLSDKRFIVIESHAMLLEYLSNCLTYWQASEIETFNDVSMLTLYLESFKTDVVIINEKTLEDEHLLISLVEKYPKIRFVLLSAGDKEYSKYNNLVLISSPVKKAELTSAFSDVVYCNTQHAQTENMFKAYQFDGEKILLVEDNLTNQEVARELLSLVNLQVTIANNGKEAIDILETAAPDEYKLVLMDIQMPVMDGLTASKQIRNSKTPYTHVPIIAMTAHSFKDDYDQSLKAGMNAHITKPIEPKVLFSTVSKYIAQKNIASNDFVPCAENKVSQSNIDQEQPSSKNINDFLADAFERLGRNTQLFSRALTIFERQRPDLLRELREQIEAADIVDACRTAHTLKGSAVNVGANLVSIEASRLEKLLEPVQHDAHLPQDLQTEINAIIQKIETEWSAFKCAASTYM
ncbi:hybrid sensor histidine kinase/response regulator [Glaciecola petra]|uniref:histidine kinase n=1 Tax=Glaciecola petra TaxID=3075602 RepID=A0ABU2ZRZ9_9ALTE|nr:ATP-binding protein [Aestuariibacter sp. P117]MDT0595413.1 ATP-binding protein [Aestuariibacter sp. P117]